MSRTATLEARLARYRSTLDSAIAERSATDTSKLDDIVELDVNPMGSSRRPGRSGLLIGAAGLVIVGGLATVVALRDRPAHAPSSPVSSTPAPRATDVAETAEPVTEGTSGPANTAPASTVAGSGTTPRCPAETGTVPTGTLYLGGPPSAQNLAATGFIFSLPSGPPAVDVALKAIAMPVLGLECSIDAVSTSDPDVITVNVEPPATPRPMKLTLMVADRDGTTGAVAIEGNTQFETGSADLRITSTIPADADRVQVRFKKGEDVWELTVAPTDTASIALEVPDGETDRFPSKTVDWVLFTVLDDQGRVLDAGGRATGV
jgi:hypothetical protein